MNKIRSRIKKRGIKKNWIAKQLDIPQSTLSMYLSEKRSMPYEIEVKINKILGI